MLESFASTLASSITASDKTELDPLELRHDYVRRILRLDVFTYRKHIKMDSDYGLKIRALLDKSYDYLERLAASGKRVGFIPR